MIGQCRLKLMRSFQMRRVSHALEHDPPDRSATLLVLIEGMSDLSRQGLRRKHLFSRPTAPESELTLHARIRR